MLVYVAAFVGLFYLLCWYRERQVVSHLQDKYVFILDMRGLRVLAACLTEEGTVILDVTQTESIAAAAQWVKECVGDRGLWGLVNNAGTSFPSAPNEWLNKQDFMNILNVNLLGVIEVTLSLLSLVRKAQGHVVNVSSIMGWLSSYIGGYCMESFLDSLRRELSCFGVKVPIIEPGFFKPNVSSSKTFMPSLKKGWDQSISEFKEIYGEKFLEIYLKYPHLLEKVWTSDLSSVTDCMEHALTACHLRTRYSAGWDVKLFYLPLSYVPTFPVDALVPLCSPKPAQAL
uniref:Uncharacterized protein n=1 Tax=Chinchilla lanigera TaxID=34839 RepID=A0A8C2VRI0_CHILA